MNRLLFIAAIITAALFVSCNEAPKTEKMTIASQQGDCVGVAPQKCLLIKMEGQTEWQFFYDQIEGFTYEPGYEYVIEVKKEEIKNPPMDRSSIKYIFVKEVSKTQKVSENLPQIPQREVAIDSTKMFVDTTFVVAK
ncbi:MAG: DUF4377 domain-containing protein [Dysgonomonas sp.]